MSSSRFVEKIKSAGIRDYIDDYIDYLNLKKMIKKIPERGPHDDPVAVRPFYFFSFLFSSSLVSCLSVVFVLAAKTFICNVLVVFAS